MNKVISGTMGVVKIGDIEPIVRDVKFMLQLTEADLESLKCDELNL